LKDAENDIKGIWQFQESGSSTKKLIVNRFSVFNRQLLSHLKMQKTHIKGIWQFLAPKSS
jgi:hypothetical protein